jgi:glyoxylase-like metal-dependent hydrolase (beta-lactamase superfamily II)
MTGGAVTVALPESVGVFVRDWLSSNQVVLRSRDGHVLVDTGYGGHAETTLALLASPHGIGAEPLAKIVNTHCHSDHVGGNAAVRRRYGCPIALPAAEADAVLRWDQQALLLDYADQRCERYGCDERLEAGETYVWGDLAWTALAAPGHDMGALVFFNDEHRLLVSGDALWEHGFGFVMPPELDPACLPATRATLDMLARLDVRTVIPGHGQPFHGVAHALERAYRRLEAFEADSTRLARHAMKVVFTFCLLDRQRMPREALPAYLARVGIYREFNAAFFRLPPAEFAAWLETELLEAGAIERDGDDLVPARRGLAAG